ncbi:MAG TPA: hypothetical protein VMD47_07355 [Candidatus Acidoferrales bacterium]|nr:hypothetical protein [Candidatus Acidoferrales bacterium]
MKSHSSSRWRTSNAALLRSGYQALHQLSIYGMVARNASRLAARR